MRWHVSLATLNTVIMAEKDEEPLSNEDKSTSPPPKNDLSKINITTEVPDVSLFEEPVTTNTGGGGMVNPPPPPPAGEKVKSGDAVLNLGPKNVTPPVVNPEVVPNVTLPPPAYMMGGRGEKDIVDFPTGSNNGGGGNSTPPPPGIDDPAGPAAGNPSGGGDDFKFQIPTSVLTGNNEAIADWAVDVIDQLVLGWMRDRPTVSKSDIYAALLKHNTREDLKKEILRKVDGWNKYVWDKISFTREERDALVNCLLEIIKNNSQIADTLTPEVRAGIMAVLILFKKFKDSSKEMPTGMNLAAEIAELIKTAPKEHVKPEKTTTSTT